MQLTQMRAGRLLLPITTVLMCAFPLAARASCSVSVSGLTTIYVPTNGSATTVMGYLTMNCDLLSGLGAYSISLSAGGGGSFNNRKMMSAGVRLNYQLYIDSGMTQVWGDGSAGTSTIDNIDFVPILGGSASFPVYMKITALQNDGPGTYTDSAAVATINY
jgi:spore coat protein U-like protein